MMSRLNISAKMTFSREELLKKLKENRDRHAQVVKEAREGYVKKAKESLMKRFQMLSEGQLVALTFNLQPPVDMTSAYDTIIQMLEMTTEPSIQLTSSEFRCLVQDEWDWSDSFWSSNSRYSPTAQSWLNEASGGALVAPPE